MSRVNKSEALFRLLDSPLYRALPASAQTYFLSVFSRRYPDAFRSGRRDEVVLGYESSWPKSFTRLD